MGFQKTNGPQDRKNLVTETLSVYGVQKFYAFRFSSDSAAYVGCIPTFIPMFTERIFSVTRRGIKRRSALKIHKPLTVLRHQHILDSKLIIPVGIISTSIVTGMVIFGDYMAQVHWTDGRGNKFEFIISPPER
jgi:hypothetical protein